MNLGRQLSLIDKGMQTIASFPEFRNTPIILSETDPEGCAACQGPQNGYRNGPLYGVSVAEMLGRSAELARLRGVNLMGDVTWAFEFGKQTYFAGFRELATSGPEGLIDKPVLNVFRMFGKLSGDQIPLTSSAAKPVEEIAKSSVTTAPDLSGIATRAGNSVSILIWNYHDEDVPADAAPVELRVEGLPSSIVRVQRWVVDAEHSNAYAAWLKMGSRPRPTAEQMSVLQKASSLEEVEDRKMSREFLRNPLVIKSSVARQGVVLYRIVW